MANQYGWRGIAFQFAPLLIRFGIQKSFRVGFWFCIVVILCTRIHNLHGSMGVKSTFPLSKYFRHTTFSCRRWPKVTTLYCLI